MNDDIRVVHHKDSGRMAENALRQRIDERTQLNEHKPEDVLRDTDATTMQDVATQEQRQTELLRFEENTPSYPQYEEESDPFETVFAQTGFEEPPIAPEPEPDRGLKPESREPLNNTDLKTEGTRAVASTLIADQSGKAGQAAPESASVQPVFTNPGTESPPESRSTEVQSSGQDYVTNRHIVPDISQPETAYENADSLFQTIYSETPFSQDTQRLPEQPAYPASTGGRNPDSHFRAVIKEPDNRSQSDADPLAAMLSQQLLDNARRESGAMEPQITGNDFVTNRHKVPDDSAGRYSTRPVQSSVQREAENRSHAADSTDPTAVTKSQRLLDKARQENRLPTAADNLVTDRHKVGEDARAQGRNAGSRSEGRGASGDLEEPLTMHTTQVLLDKAKRKDRIDRMLNDNPEHNIDPDAVLKPSGDQPPGLLDAGAPEESARTPSASASRLLKGPAALLALGGRAAAGALLSSQLYEHQEGADADSQSILNAAKDGGRGVRTLRRGIRKLQRRRTTQRAAQTGRAAAQAADEAVKKAAENGGKKLFGAIAEGAKELLAAVGALVGGAVTPIIVVILAILMVIVMFMSIFTSMVGSPYGIFFVKEQQQELEFSTAISRITSDYFSTIYEREMSKDYESVEVDCGITDSNQTWKEIVAVYAVDVCKQGLDAITMDQEHYEILKDVFWDKISISFSETSRTERVETVVREAHTERETHYYDPMGYEVPSPVAGGSSQTVTINVPAEIEVSYVTYITLHIKVEEKSLDALKAARGFDEGEKRTVDDLLAEPDTLWASLEEDFTNLIITGSGDDGGEVGAIDVTAYATVGETVFRALIQEGYTPQAACGILGNIQQECSMNPKCVTGNAYGLCQWLGDRKAKLMRLRGYSSASVQTGFMISELRSDTWIWHTFGGEVNHRYAGVHITSLSQFKRCSSVRAAAGAFCICFERPGEFPGNKWYEARLNYASQWYRYAQSHWMGTN